jgi:CRISPR system Cascade subunit CasE
MHSTLCRAFTVSETKCPQGAFLWRLEPERSVDDFSKVIVQSQQLPDWSRINIAEWFAEEPAPPLDLSARLRLDSLKEGGRFRYRLRANPSVCHNGKRLGLFTVDEQIAWLNRKGEQNGFSLISIHRSEERMLSGKVRNGYPIRVFSVLYDGIMAVTDAERFQIAIAMGIGHAKAMGLGLLSVMPVK